jgi:hypothetical protein
MLGQLLHSFIAILVGVNLAPTIANQVAAVTNITGSALSLLNLVPLFFVLVILAAGIRGSVSALADIGMI